MSLINGAPARRGRGSVRAYGQDLCKQKINCHTVPGGSNCTLTIRGVKVRLVASQRASPNVSQMIAAGLPKAGAALVRVAYDV